MGKLKLKCLSQFHFPKYFFCFRTPESKTYREKRVVPFTPEEVYFVVADVAKYKEFLPYCVNRSEEYI